MSLPTVPIATMFKVTKYGMRSAPETEYIALPRSVKNIKIYTPNTAEQMLQYQNAL